MRVLGLDVGNRRIGLALSDPGGFLASSLGAIERRGSDKDIRSLLALVNQRDVERVVVGLPKHLDGSLGEQALKVQAFAERLKEACPVPLEFWDERFSTVTAQERLREAGAKRPTRGRVDSAAAAFILQGYLDNLQREGASHL
ncbi:MAG: Holliday junction resolvase RuvX [Dehalococcoidia bacterium]|nr:Holliday junction resolvase RuvX [Dehalococcoidia bacterium]